MGFVDIGMYREAEHHKMQTMVKTQSMPFLRCLACCNHVTPSKCHFGVKKDAIICTQYNGIFDTLFDAIISPQLCTILDA